MSNFETIITEIVEKEEGGFNNIAQDKGGATKYGISLRFLKILPELDGDVTGDGHVNINDVQQLGEAKAKDFYRRYFWDFYQLERYQDKDLQAKMMSFLINMRSKVAHKCLQRALRSLGFDHIVDDGVIGEVTMMAINKVLSVGWNQTLVSALRSEAAGVYRQICIKDESQKIFLKGWLNRAYR